MTAQEFHELQLGDVLTDEASGETFFINQVRFPGFYIAGNADLKTLTADRASVLRKLGFSETMVLVGRKGERVKA